MSRLLILVERSDDAPSVDAWLRPMHTVLGAHEENLQEPLDLLIIDAPALNRLEDQIAEHKALDADDAFPVLLLATHEDLLQVTPRGWSLVDAILKLPVQSSELISRVEWLVQTQMRLHQVKHSQRQLQEQADEIKKVNRAVLTLSACNHALVQADSEAELLREICRVTVEIGGYRMAWVGIPQDDDQKLIRPVASAGYDHGYLAELPLSWDEDHYGGQGPAARAIRTGQRQVVQHISSHPTFVRQKQVAERGYQAVVTLPLFEDDRVCAVLVVYAEEPNSFDTHELELLQQLSADLSYGITRLREREAHQAAQSVFARVQANYEQIVEKAQEGIWLLDADFKTDYVNQRMADMLGYSPEEMIGHPIVDFIYPDAAANVPELMDLRRRGVSSLTEIVYQDKQGRAVYCLLSSNPMLNEQGELIGVLGMVVDITERRRMEQALREQSAFEESLRDIASVLTSTLDLKQVMVRILENVGKVVPHDAGNIMIIEGDRTRPLFWRGDYGDYQDETFRQLDYSIDSGTFRIMLKTGQPVVLPSTEDSDDWFGNQHNAWIKSYIGMPIRAHGAIIGFLNLDSATPNFFDQRRAQRLQVFADQAAIAIENAQLYERMRGYASELEKRVDARTTDLQRAKEELEAILNSSSDAVLVMSLTGAILKANRAFSQLTGRADDQQLLDYLDEESAEAVSAALNDAIVLEQPVRVEANLRRSDNTLISAELTLAPMLSAHLGGIVCNIHDVTERKLVEQELRRALEVEKELVEAKSRFISMASHEFRTPLAVVLSSSELLKLYADRMTDERRAEHFNIIESSVKNLTRLIDDVLIIGRVDSGRMEFSPGPLDLVPFCRSVSDEIMVALPDRAPVDFSSSVTSLEAVADPRLLRQLLSNLLSNAIKYTPDQTPVEFSLTCTDDSAILTIVDHGLGMSEKDMRHLFEAFYRSPQVSEIPGTGLGLAIMKRAVDLHGGTVDFTSTLGNGTKVVVTLPLQGAARDRAAAPQNANA